MKSIYLDNAATSWPKPPGVAEALSNYYREIGASAGRGSYQRALTSAKTLYEAREMLAKLFNTDHSERFIFTLNATMALNMAIKGVLAPGDRVITSTMEHNSVLRPLEGLKERIGIKVEYLPASSEGLLNPNDFKTALEEEPTRMVILVHASNVCGAIQPISEVGRLAREHGALFLVDAAQTAGVLPINLEELEVDLLAFPGHKGLLGPLGTGALWIRDGLEISPLVEGGTGTQSDLVQQPDDLPDKYEAGSHNVAGISGLKVALDYIMEHGVDSILRHERGLAKLIRKGLGEIDKVTVLGPKNTEHYTGVVSFNVAGMDPAEVGMILDGQYGIMVRTGLHCAPLAHKALGTYATGSVRASVGPFSTVDDVETLVAGVARISQGVS